MFQGEIRRCGTPQIFLYRYQKWPYLKGLKPFPKHHFGALQPLVFAGVRFEIWSFVD